MTFLEAVCHLSAKNYGSPPAACEHPTPAGGWWWVGWAVDGFEHRLADRMSEDCARFFLAALTTVVET